MLARGGRRRGTQRPSLSCCFCSSVERSIAILASHLRWCARSKALQEGMVTHHHIVKQNLHRNPFLLNLVLLVYGEAAALNDAHALFSVCSRDVFSYNFMMAAYARVEGHAKVLHVFCRMHHEAVLPDQMTYSAVVSALASLLLFTMGRFLHACILHFMHVSVATAIMYMYGKYGSLHDAQVTFQHMHDRDVVAWNCIIGVHVDHNMGKEALVLYEQMKPEGITPDIVTFVNLLSACNSTSDLHAGECIHTDIVSRGFEINTVVGNALVGMYAKLCSLESSRLVFEKMRVHNVVSWNTIIGAYSRDNGGIEALNLFNVMQEKGIEPNKITVLNVIPACPPQTALSLFDTLKDGDVVAWNALISAFSVHKECADVMQLFYQMQLEGVMPNKVTLSIIVSMCSTEQGISLGKRIHALVVGNGQEHDTSIGNALINMYHNCYSLKHAEDVFGSMVNRTVVTWTVMVSVLSYYRKYAEAVQLFDRMLLEGSVPDKFVCASALDACVSLVGLAEGKRFHTRILVMELDMDVVLGTALLNMYGECGSLRVATAIFDELCEQNKISCNAFIAACAHHGQAHMALDLFHQMQAINITPDSSTFVSILTGCSHSGLLEQGIFYFSSMQNNYDLLLSVEHYDCIIDLIGRAGQVTEAEYLIKIVHVNPSAISYRTLLGACQKSVDIVCAHQAAGDAFILDPENEGCYVLLSNRCVTLLPAEDVT